MAAPAAAVGANAAANFAAREARRFEADPWHYTAQKLIHIGTGCVLGGLGAGTLGYFLKAAATAAANNEKHILGNIGTIFSNIVPPTFQPAATGTAPLSWSLQGVQNFASDAWTDIQAAGADVAQMGAAIGTLAEDVGIALTDVAKAFLAFVMHFPDILWNGAIWAVGGGIADILNWSFPYFVILGAVLLAVGFTILAARKLWTAGIAQPFEKASGKWLSRQQARMERGFDKLFRNFSETTTAPVAPEPVVPIAPPAIAEVPLPTPPIGPNPPPEPEISHVTPPPESTNSVPGGATTAEVEQHLGEHPTRAPTPEELQKLAEESEANRVESNPAPDPAPPPDEFSPEDFEEPDDVLGSEESQRANDAFAAEEAGA